MKERALIPRAKIRSALRLLWMRSPERRRALKSRELFGNSGAWICQCGCKRTTSEPEVDHVNPVGSAENLEEFAEKLFVPAAELRVLDRECHKRKTLGDRKKGRSS